ncbi:MAG: hypothetical protein FJ297_03455 [Planctomycetes bacterium]|nr:hypothetical protein [Planctomycetota bacterium]
MPKSILEVAKLTEEFFMGTSAIHASMRRLASTLGEMRIAFAVAGAMAANAHGHRRTTADVDILIRGEDLDCFKQRYRGRGWVDKFGGSKNFRDAVCDVNIDVLLVGEYPGDGLPKPVAFPCPEDVREIGADGIPYVSLAALLELKMASGMTAPHRPRDLDDVIQLIRVNRLSLDYVESLNPYVHEKYRELWRAAQIDDDR